MPCLKGFIVVRFCSFGLRNVNVCSVDSYTPTLSSQPNINCLYANLSQFVAKGISANQLYGCLQIRLTFLFTIFNHKIFCKQWLYSPGPGSVCLCSPLFYLKRILSVVFVYCKESVICPHPKTLGRCSSHRALHDNKQKSAHCHYCSQKQSLLKSDFDPKVFLRRTSSIFVCIFETVYMFMYPLLLWPYNLFLQVSSLSKRVICLLFIKLKLCVSLSHEIAEIHLM